MENLERTGEGAAVPYFDADLLLWYLLWMDRGNSDQRQPGQGCPT